MGDIMYRVLAQMKGKDRGTVEDKGRKFYFKRNDADVEILMEKIADFFQLNHAHYYPTTVHGLQYYISEDLNAKGNFVTAEDAGIDFHSTSEIRDAILLKYPNDFEKIMKDFMKMYFMDLLTLNIDRNNGTWGFLQKDGHTELCVLDNDLAFIYENSLMTSCENPNRSTMTEIENVLDTFPPEYIVLFLEMYQNLNTETLEKIMRDCEDEMEDTLPHKHHYIERFEILREKIENYLKEKHKEYIKTEA